MKRLKTTARISGGDLEDNRLNDPRRPSVADDKRNNSNGNQRARNRQSSTPDALLTPNQYSQRNYEQAIESRMGKSVPNVSDNNYYSESNYRMHQSTQELRPNPNDYYQGRNDQRRGIPVGMIPPRKHLPDVNENRHNLPVDSNMIPSGFRNDYNNNRRPSNERNDSNQQQRRPSNERNLYDQNYNRRPSNEREMHDQNQQRRPSNERINYERPINDRLEVRRASNDDSRKTPPNQRQKPKKVSGMLDSVLADYEQFISKRK